MAHRILLVEDQVSLRSHAARALRLEAYDVTEACDGFEAWGLAKKARFDLIITDSQMPPLSEVEFVARVRDLHPALPILRIYGSHYSGPEEIGVRTLFKPFTIDALTRMVGSMLQTDATPDPEKTAGTTFAPYGITRPSTLGPCPARARLEAPGPAKRVGARTRAASQTLGLGGRRLPAPWLCLAGYAGQGAVRGRASAGLPRGSAMTPAELSLLNSLAQADVVTFIPEDNTAAALARFEGTLESLREMQKAGWVELEVAEDRKRVRGRHRQKVKGAAARCTEAGREALRLLGE